MKSILKKCSAFALGSIVSFCTVFSMPSFSMPGSNIAYAEETETEKGQKEKLYYGYNVTSGKSLMANDALCTAAPIIDPTSDYLNNVYKSTGNTEQDSGGFSSASMTEVADFLSEKICGGVQGNVGLGKIASVSADIGKVFDTSKTVKNCCAVYYDVYTTSITRYNYVVQLSLSEIRKYLSKTFSEEIQHVGSVNDAKAFLNRYGTHLITGYSLGGRLTVTNYKSTSNSSYDFSEAKSLREKISATISKVNAGESASIVEEYGTYENTEESKSIYQFKSYGGEAISSLTLDDLFTYNASVVDGTKSGFMYTRWIDSINNEQNLAIIGIPSQAQCIPVWDLLESTSENLQIRQYLIDAYSEMCGDAYIDFTLEYPEFERSINITKTKDKKFIFNGLYVKTVGDYFYYIDAEDFTPGGLHGKIYPRDLIYLDLSETGYDQYEFETQGCEIVDGKKGIFRVTKSSGQMVIKCKYPDDNTQIICNVPIESCPFEGGTGTEKYPYLIKIEGQFYNISKDLSARYILLNDIDFKNKKLSVMGDFHGVLDGNYCTLKNFTLDNFEDWGLFATNSGTIMNLRIDNAGTSVSETEFFKGGKNHKDNAYTTNSIAVRNAGILCGQNNGVIDNCYIQNSYIRNIVKNSDKLIGNSSITLSIGMIAGINNGTIKNCMVNTCNSLGAFINTTTNEYKIYVYSGGLCGQMKGGKVLSCVYDSGESGSISSVIYNDFKGRIAGFGSKGGAAVAYSGGLVGYCNGTGSFKSSYAHCGEKSSITSKLDFDFGFHDKQEPSVYRSLSTPTMVLKKNAEIEMSNVYAYSGTGSDVRAMEPEKNGEINNENKSFSYASDSELMIKELKVNSENEFNRIELDNIKFSSHPPYMCSSHIEHILTRTIEYVENDDSTLQKSYFVGGCFSPIGLVVNRKINDGDVKLTMPDEVKVFKISLTDEEGVAKSLFDTPFNEIIDGKYCIKILSNNDTVKSEKININVEDAGVTKLTLANREINYDDKKSFVDNFSFDSTEMSATLSDGTVVPLTSDSKSAYVQKGKIKCQTSDSSIGLGDNQIHVSYVYDDGMEINSTFILTAKRKEITSVDVTNEPLKTEYTAGEQVDTSGMELTVNYSDGTKKVVSGDEVKKLELIGGRVTYGKNEVTVVYSDYSKTAKFIVYGTATETNVEPTPEPTIEPTPEPTPKQEATSQPKKGLPIGWIIVGVVLIIGCISGAVFYIYYKKKRKPVSIDNPDK